MSDKMSKSIKAWLDANVHDGEDRSGTTDVALFTPDGLQELVEECLEAITVHQPEICHLKWRCALVGADDSREWYEEAMPGDSSDDGTPAFPVWDSPQPEQYEIGIYGKAYDGPGKHRAYTYKEQPDNSGARRLGEAARDAHPGGDAIDHGLSLLGTLQEQGFGVFEIGRPEPPKGESK